MIRAKRLGGYLMEAGLLSNDQVTVALNDQRATGMRFGEVVVARGWLKEQTVEWVMEKVVLPERSSVETHQKKLMNRQAIKQRQVAQKLADNEVPASSQSRAVARIPAPPTHTSQSPTMTQSSTVQQDREHDPQSGFNRREAPISKPLPSVKSNDGDVNWVG
jgi:hypothetical protein